MTMAHQKNLLLPCVFFIKMCFIFVIAIILLLSYFNF